MYSPHRLEISLRLPFPINFYLDLLFYSKIYQNCVF